MDIDELPHVVFLKKFFAYTKFVVHSTITIKERERDRRKIRSRK